MYASAISWSSFIFLIITPLAKVNALLYPASSSMSVTASVSVPITELLPDRRVIVDWCFNMGYDLPSTVAQFYNIPIWPGSTGPKSKRDISNTTLLEHPHSHGKFFNKYRTRTDLTMHPKDFSAGELYEGIEDLLSGYGFHETCLLRTVCELSRHPFEEGNILTDLITFILTPSQHEGFIESERVYQETYENAEMQGFLGKDCAAIYNHCKWDILNSLTTVLFHNKS